VNGRTPRLSLAALAFLLLFPGLFARDYFDPDEILFPLDVPGEPGALNGYYGLLEAGAYAFMSDSRECFYIKGTGAPTLYRYGDRFAANLFFSSILINGPVGADETPANIANFWMNGAQFEYGANLGFRGGAFDFAWSYARASLHPLRSGFSDAAADRQILRARRKGIALGQAELVLSLSAEWDDLYDFWNDPSLGKPRTLVAVSPSLRIESPVPGLDPDGTDSRLYALFAPDVVFTRAGTVETDFYGEAGFRKNRAVGADFFLQAYYSRDTEMVADARHEAFYAGLGVRFR